jgi:hypothetical protein
VTRNRRQGRENDEMKNAFLTLWLAATILISAAAVSAYEGRVYDSETLAPIADAVVTHGSLVTRTDFYGRFHLENVPAGAYPVLRLRAPGYWRRDFAHDQHGGTDAVILLEPLTVKALYLSVYGIGSRRLREAALDTLRKNGMNALVIDVKGDRGFIPFRIDLPAAAAVGAQKIITVRDMPTLLDELRREGIYLIARIVVFKDDLLAAARPDWAVKTASGAPYRDFEKLQWVDPFVKEAWQYNIAIARIAAEMGFEEIQFDYVRFPDKPGLRYAEPVNEASRTAAITGFLQAASQALIPYNVQVAADIFGYVLWNANDTDIGQKLVPILDSVDIVSPMLYPSGFQFGIPGYPNPVSHPYEIVYLSLKRAQERSRISPLRFRPWLQAFRDYAFGAGEFGDERVRTQIRAAETFGSSGWLLWNPRNIYPRLQVEKGIAGE